MLIATSLDGFIARLDGSIDWLLSRDAAEEDLGYTAFIKEIDGLVMGRGTFESILRFDPWPYSKPMVVLSKILAGQPVPEHLAGRVRYLDLLPKAAMDRLAANGWRRVYVDGGQIVQAFLRDGLIEDMEVTVVSVLIGTGRSLFGPTKGDVPLEHLGTTSFPSGLVQSRYRIGG